MANANADAFDERVRRMLPVTTTEDEREHLVKLWRWFENLHAQQTDLSNLRLMVADGKTLKVPGAVAHVLEWAVEVMARGESVSVVPVPTELTSQQAADLLNVSRQYLVRLLDEGKMPFSRVGRHRRINSADVLAFKRERDGKRREALRELTQLTEDLGGYEAEFGKRP